MAKAKYNPLRAFRDDPLAALKQATGIQVDLSAAAEDGNEDRLDESPLGISGGRSEAPIKPLAATLKPSRNTVYLYPDDLTKLRQLSGYASTEHGMRANDSMIVRAALSLMEADVRFLHALKEAELSDGRRTKAS